MKVKPEIHHPDYGSILVNSDFKSKKKQRENEQLSKNRAGNIERGGKKLYSRS